MAARYSQQKPAARARSARPAPLSTRTPNPADSGRLVLVSCARLLVCRASPPFVTIQFLRAGCARACARACAPAPHLSGGPPNMAPLPASPLAARPATFLWPSRAASRPLIEAAGRAAPREASACTNMLTSYTIELMLGDIFH